MAGRKTLWILDTRPPHAGRYEDIGDGTGISPFRLVYGNSTANWVVGSFVANNTFQPITLTGYDVSGSPPITSTPVPQLNLLQLRTVPVPEPTSGLMIAGCLLGLSSRRRRAGC